MSARSSARRHKASLDGGCGVVDLAHGAWRAWRVKRLLGGGSS